MSSLVAALGYREYRRYRRQSTKYAEDFVAAFRRKTERHADLNSAS